tara:strand:+ start:3360 stop:5288 length:1929 start_codon:yes stop_codon:yes gene_type:complete
MIEQFGQYTKKQRKKCKMKELKRKYFLLNVFIVIFVLLFLLINFKFGITGFLVVDLSDDNVSDFDSGIFSNTTFDGENVTLFNQSLTLNYTDMGNFTSQIFDASLDVNWTNLSWISDEPSNTNLTITARSCNDSACDVETFSDNLTNGQDLTPIISENRYFQYKAEFLSDDADFTAYLQEVNISYLQFQTPNLNEPLNNSFLKITPEFNWSNSSDSDFLILNYTIEISDDITFSYTNYSNTTLMETANVTQDFSVSLEEDSEYYWRVLASNGTRNSSFSEIRTFTLDTTLPNEFNLSSPNNNSNITDTQPLFTWQEITEINFKNYTLEISNDSNFNSINFTFTSLGIVSNNSFNGWNDSQKLNNETWYWRVTAYDKALNNRTSDTFKLIYKDPFEDPGGIGGTTTSITFSGGSKGVRKLEQVSLELLQPNPLSLFTNNTIITPLTISNKGNVALRNLNLEALVGGANLDLELSRKTIEILFPGQTLTIDLFIRSRPNTEIKDHEITIEANVLEPNFKDSIKFFVNLLEFGFGDKQLIAEKTSVVQTLFKENPECAELQNLLDKSQIAFEENDLQRSLILLEEIIQSCKELVSSLGRNLIIEEPPTFKRDLYIALTEVAVVLLLFSSIYMYYRKRKLLKKYKK